MPDILSSAQSSTPLLPAGFDLPYSTHGSGLPPEPEPEPTVPPPVPKKHGSKSLIMAVLLFLLATLPLAVYFTSQQNQLADLRGRAQQGPYEMVDDDPCRSGFRWNRSTTNPVCTEITTGITTIPGTSITVTTTQAPGTGTTGTGTGAAAACWGIGGGQVERDCLAQARSGTYTSGDCRGLTVEQCAARGRAVYCSGSQEAAGTARAGEFLSCGASSTGGCGQVDVFDSNNNLIGFVIDKTACGGSPPTTTTSNPPSRKIHVDTPPGNTPTSTPTGAPTATPTPIPPGGTCELIKLYDSAGTEITQAVRNRTKKLAIGEQVTIATTKGNATKARFRIQGIADWAENDPSKTTATEYRLSINIPSTLTQSQGTFEVEVFVNGVWK